MGREEAGRRTFPCKSEVGGMKVARWGAAAACLLALACELEDPPAPPEGARDESATVSGFDGERAFADLVDQVRIGPRPAGSPGAERVRELIRVRLRQAGWRSRDHEFRAQPPSGAPVAMTNVIGMREGERDELILVVAHYDTKLIPGVRFVGANDGASGTAVLLELARQLSTRSLPFGVWLVFFDGEEAFGKNITGDDGLYGSRALARELDEAGTLQRVAALILVDMVADADLNLALDGNSSPALRRILLEEAEKLELASLFDSNSLLRLIDDHTPFARRGTSDVLAIIDFQYGDRSSPGPYWHTAEDDLDKVSVESLNSVGRLLVETLQGVERYLLESERARAPQGAIHSPSPSERDNG